MKFNAVEKWLANVAFSHSGSPSTKAAYTRHLNQFCTFIDTSPEQILEQYEKSTDRKFRREYAGLVKTWIANLLSEGYSKSSVTVMVGSIKSFFKYSDLPLSFIPLGKAGSVFHNRDITREEIESIIGASNRARDRAYFAVMAQSGLRPHTLCLLRVKHVELNREAPACVKVPQEIAKGKYRGYLTFVGPKALEYLQHYLNGYRPNLTGNSFLFTQHDTEDKLDRRTMSHRFRDAVLRLKDSGNIEYSQKEKGKAGTIRLYSLRKWFRKCAGQAGFSYVQYWMGHVLKNQDEHYFPTDINDPNTVEYHRQVYLEKAMPNLRIEEPSPLEHEAIIKRQQEEIEKLKKETERLRAQAAGNVELKRRLDKMEKEFAQIRKYLAEVELIHGNGTNKQE